MHGFDSRKTQGATVPGSAAAQTVPEAAAAPSQACFACGSPQARSWSTSVGPVRLCPTCAVLHDIGCP